MGFTLPTLRRGAGVHTSRNDQAQSFIQLATGAIVLIVTVLIFNEINASLPTTSGGINSSAVAPIVLLVIVASLVLFQVSGFGRMR
jgi:hypothetical protein